MNFYEKERKKQNKRENKKKENVRKEGKTVKNRGILEKRAETLEKIENMKKIVFCVKIATKKCLLKKKEGPGVPRDAKMEAE